MSTPTADMQAARQLLADHGWISRRNESFHHLPPPALQQWLGEAQAPVDAGPGWQLLGLDGQAMDAPAGVQADWLDALQPEQRSQLLAGLPAPSGDSSDAAPFVWAHRALCRQGLRLAVGAGSTPEQPARLQLRHTARGAVDAPLLVIDVQDGAHCVLLESHDFAAAPEDAAQNLLIHIRLGAGASLQHLRVVAPRAGQHVAHHVLLSAGAGAEYAQALVASDSAYHLQRADLDLQGDGAQARHSGLVLAAGHTLDHQVWARHGAPRTVSKVETLSLASGRARSVANSFTHIASGADDADVFQRLWGVALSGQPRLYMRPHMEILHDQVQASHGATWGKLPEDALFYAAQRGLDPVTAQQLIVEGMAHAVLARSLEDGPGSGQPSALLQQWLDTGWLDQTLKQQLQLAEAHT